MNINSLTIKAQEALQSAMTLARSGNNQSVEPIHLLSTLIAADDSVSVFLLSRVGANISQIRNEASGLLSMQAKVSGSNTDQFISTDTSKLLQRAQDATKSFNDKYVSLEHILLALVEERGEPSNILKRNGVTSKELVQAIKEFRKGSTVDSQTSEKEYDALGKYAINLNEQARSGKLDPVIGRDEEIRRVLQILSRRTKNNPILVGEAGVGKTAIAEGLAHRIINNDVPENLSSKTLFSLDMGALIAGAKYKGEFEERLKSVVAEVIASDGEILLFIDEIHTLIGAGKSDGAMDAANILKPALARGELRTIGATTLDEYQKYFEKDKALERRFQKVVIDEPTVDDAVSILRGLKERYETHHKVRIKDEAIIAAVQLSVRYITSRHLPDKAIDLIDESAARLRLEMNSVPEEVDALERKIRMMEIEREAIKREDDKPRIDALSREIEEFKSEYTAMRAKWQGERDLVTNIQQTKEHIEDLKLQAKQAERDGDYGKVAEIQYGRIMEAQKSVDHLLQELERLSERGMMIKEEVDSNDVAEVVSRWTGIPVNRMLSSEREKLLNMESELHKRVIGQESAIVAISDAVRRSRAGLSDPRKPIGSFIFLGSTGVGKTELARALAQFLFNDESMMTRIDMSEYQEKHSVSRLVGAPPGYVGYDEGGQLTEAVRRKPYSVVLLDEIEKAHPDTFNILLQILDDGRLTDNKGRTVDFRNTIIIMTSNMGSSIIQSQLSSFTGDGIAIAAELLDTTRRLVVDELKQHLKPEFINRIDEIVMFEPLTKGNIAEIVNIQLSIVRDMLSQNGIDLDYDSNVVNWIVNEGYDPLYGARPVKRTIQREVVNDLSKRILAGSIDREHPITISVIDGSVQFTNRSL